jgi:peptidoglycan/xylan/chitin deacetylase (PgdA/CDA1 family)
VLAAVFTTGCVTVTAPPGAAGGAGAATVVTAPPAPGGAIRLATAPPPGAVPAVTPAAGGALAAPGLQPTAAVATAAAAAAAEHPHAQEIATIRRHHLKRLDDKLNIAPQLLIDSCRYESDISTRPPQKRVALTFDDGPEPGQTEQILAVLARYNITAAFFMIGEKMQRHPDLVARVRDGHHQIVGNHSWNHPNFHEISPALQADEVLREDALLGAGGADPRKLFRYPFGNASCETNTLVRARGYRIVGWHIDSCDWAFEKTGAVDFQEATSCGVLPQYRADYVGHVVSAVRARNGGIVLMHEIHPNTVAKLEEVVQHILADGYTFGTVLDAEFEPSLR